jgi:hypothetical protein
MEIVCSQERIITVESDTIHVKIMEVSDNIVSYKRYPYQEEATFAKRFVFVDTYNEYCAGKRPLEVSETIVTWKFQPSVGGLSFSLNF